MLLLALGAISSPGLAQSVPASPTNTEATRAVRNATGNGSGYRALDPGFEDVGPLGQSLQLQRIDIRQDQNFARVYGVNDGTGRYVRRDGAINAVFPQSDYATFNQRSGAVTVPLVPAGTIFYIGDPATVDAAQNPRIEPTGADAGQNVSGHPLAQRSGAARLTRLSNRVASRDELVRRQKPDFPSASDLAHFQHAPPFPTDREGVPALRIRPRRVDVMTNPEYRRERLREMTRRTVLELIEKGRTIDPSDRKEPSDPGAVSEDLSEALER